VLIIWPKTVDKAVLLHHQCLVQTALIILHLSLNLPSKKNVRNALTQNANLDYVVTVMKVRDVPNCQRINSPTRKTTTKSGKTGTEDTT